MLEQTQINKIKDAVKEFFEKMTIVVSGMDVSLSSNKIDTADAQGVIGESRDVVDLDVKVEEPQILIGQQGQTLFEIQRLLRTVLNKKLQTTFYFNLDINEYKKKKVEYLKDLAKTVADQVSLTKEERAFAPMSAYERRIIHSELAQREDVVTESRGKDFERCVVVRPK